MITYLCYPLELIQTLLLDNTQTHRSNEERTYQSISLNKAMGKSFGKLNIIVVPFSPSFLPLFICMYFLNTQTHSHTRTNTLITNIYQILSKYRHSIINKPHWNEERKRFATRFDSFSYYLSIATGKQTHLSSLHMKGSVFLKTKFAMIVCGGEFLHTMYENLTVLLLTTK